MSFINFPSPTPVFPALPPQAWSVHKVPTFQKTLTSVAISGREYQINRQVVPRFEFTLVYGGDSWLRDETQNINPFNPLAGYTELEQLAGLFTGCLGSYGEFYYTDPDDNSRLNQVVATGDGTTDVFTLYFTWGTGPFTPPAYYPVTGISSLDAVYLNGVLQDPSTYSLDSTLTQVVFEAAPGLGVAITADFHFYYRCRFLNDIEEFDQWAKNLWESRALKFISVKNEITPPFCLPSVTMQAPTNFSIANLPTLPSSSDNFLLAGWIMGLSVVADYFVFGDNGNAGITLTITVPNNLQSTLEIVAYDSSSNPIFDLAQTYGEDFTHADFHSFAISADTTTQVVQIMVDGTLGVFTPTTTPGVWQSSNPIAFFPSSDPWELGPVVDGAVVTMSDLRFGVGEGFFDLTIPANAAKLFTIDNGPVKWGSNGQNVTGVTPAVYLHGDYTSYATNQGTGGAFTLTGSLNTTSPMVCSGHRPQPDAWGPPPFRDPGISAGNNSTGGVLSISSDISSHMTTIDTTTLIFIGVAYENGLLGAPAVSGISGGGLAFSRLTGPISAGGMNSGFEIWWARSAGILTNVSFTVSFSVATRNATFNAVAIANSNYFAAVPFPFDPLVSTPLVDSETIITPTVTIARTGIPNDMLLFFGCGVPFSVSVLPPTGFTAINGSVADAGGGAGVMMGTSFMNVNSLQTTLTVAQSSGGFPGACGLVVISGIP